MLVTKSNTVCLAIQGLGEITYTFVCETDPRRDCITKVRTVLNEEHYPLDLTDRDVIAEALNPLLAELGLAVVTHSRAFSDPWGLLLEDLTILWRDHR